VRKGKKEKIEREGFGIECLDLRKGGGRINTEFHPVVIDDFDSHNDFDLIMVAGNSNQLDSILTLLSEKQGRADVMFLQNIWDGFENIEKRLKSGSFLLKRRAYNPGYRRRSFPGSLRTIYGLPVPSERF
jgi:ketopantoate reductase